MTSQTFLIMSSVTSFNGKFQRVFDQTKHCKTLLGLHLGELYGKFSRLEVKNCFLENSGLVGTCTARGG